MLESILTHIQNPYLVDHDCSENSHIHQYYTALTQFQSVLCKGKMFFLISKALKRQPHLYDLNVMKPHLHVRGTFYSGMQVVPIRSIIGSEGRAADFDRHFRPLSGATRERWINMAIVYLSLQPLLPIQLIRVGDVYFVRNGHHRISVSRTFGQTAIDAEVITWKATPPFPWQPGAVAENSSLLASPHLSR